MGTTRSFLFLMGFLKEYRNLFYHRIGILGRVISIICPKMASLFIHTPKIGEGLYIQHGFATIISAHSIGKNCWINQQVTIGWDDKGGRPIIGDNVTINCGAKVIGGVTIGNNVTIGAGTVVVKDIPDNCTVVGSKAFIIKKNGIRVREEL